jgi:hypothetical protein
MLDETDIQKLLRLKRYELPPAGYHERFLREFHRRQRAEMLREPAWKIALERIGAFFSDHGMGRLAYGSATVAVLLFAGVASYKMLNDSGSPTSPIAANMPSYPVSGAIAATTPSDSQAMPLRGTIDTSLPAPQLPQLNTSLGSAPRYIIGTRPASYERPFSF